MTRRLASILVASGLLLISVQVQGFYLPTSAHTNLKTQQQATFTRERIPLSEAHRNCHLSTKATNAEDVVHVEKSIINASPRTNQNRLGRVFSIPFLKDNKVVLLTALTVAMSAMVAIQLPLQSAGALQMRRNIFAGTIIFTLGDLGAQWLTRHSTSDNNQHHDKTTARTKFQLDQPRLAIATTLGVIWAGMFNPFVYATVERLVPAATGGAEFGRVLLKMVMSCSILSTGGNYFTMFFRRCLLTLFARDNKTEPLSTVRHVLEKCVKSCNRDIKEVLLDDLKIWPLYDIVCFSLIPPAIRPITNAIMSSLWSMYMSIASAKTSTRSTSTAVSSDATVIETETSEQRSGAAEQQDTTVIKMTVA